MSIKIIKPAKSSNNQVVSEGNLDYSHVDYVLEMQAIIDLVSIVELDALDPNTIPSLMNILSRYIPCERQAKAMFDLKEFNVNLKDL